MHCLEGHIFHLNNVWLDLNVLLDRCAEDASLLDEDCLLRDAVVTKDVIYEELFQDTGYVEFDALMQECLEMICCTCGLVVQNQLDIRLLEYPCSRFILFADCHVWICILVCVDSPADP